MSHVVIVGCGVIGAAIAYELSQVKGLKITVVDKQPPVQGSTGVALGVLMGIISHKVKSRAWRLRQQSVQRYGSLIPELEEIIQRKIPCNRQGIVSICLEDEELKEDKAKDNNLQRWQKLQEIRQSQGWKLEIWDTTTLQKYCPQVNLDRVMGAIYSPQDLQIDPTALTLALIDAARIRGADFKFDVTVSGELSPSASGLQKEIATTNGKITADWFIISAGLGSTGITTQLNQTVDIRPVLGQALQLRLGHCLGNPQFQPTITGNDVHIVPVGAGVLSEITEYWVGATVEFVKSAKEIAPNKQLLEDILQQAITFCPELTKAAIIKTWSGSRPRPEGRPAPIIERLPGFDNVILATGHYRNGILLAPATAGVIREMILSPI
ncbi:FAD-dependent oxidoreductase [Mastigocoleus sp. MO_188.B34]|uniref:NAD(P)/FAD-dependent oxidoreductase n=1 Tax=Mastigocoleus sp. MO_188.B34 TaxID=3036635 RepID=UPI0026328BB9|nr:FAD-dependent oxidoreductase [Mastigocoleus sp. MO_188.B34]MDJ0695206.1 FAD-dependent oxidoreductase [Mastigocoleus sp. MO_188.B34]